MRRIRSERITWLALGALAISAPSLEAQVVARSISGVVRDTLGRPLENAVIALNPVEAVRATRATAGGRFRFDRINPGRYILRTTWIGYLPDERTIVVPPEGLQIDITLVPVPFRLDTLTIVARRTGVFGTTVQRTDFRALGGVEVSVLGSRHRIRTEADGLFSFGDLREGGWVVLGKRDGFESRMIPVAVPDSAAVELALALDSAATKEQQIANMRVLDMGMRLNRRQANASAIVARQEFAVHRRQTLDIALRYSPSFLATGLRIENVECVFINGRPSPSMTARDIIADDVAMVEVYNHRGGVNYQDLQLFRRNGTDCGSGPVQEVFGSGGMQLRAVRPAKETTVAYIHIWTK